jgi:hypothetical protein
MLGASVNSDRFLYFWFPMIFKKKSGSFQSSKPRYLVVIPRREGYGEHKPILTLVIGIIIMANCMGVWFPALYLIKPSKPICVLLGLILCLLIFALSVVAGLRFYVKYTYDCVLGYDRVDNLVVLADRFYGKPKYVRYIARDQIDAIRLSWRLDDTNTLPDGQGRWIAYLAMVNGKAVDIGSVKGAKSGPPAAWVKRFRKAGEFINKPYEQLIGWIPVQFEGNGNISDEKGDLSVGNDLRGNEWGRKPYPYYKLELTKSIVYTVFMAIVVIILVIIMNMNRFR